MSNTRSAKRAYNHALEAAGNGHIREAHDHFNYAASQLPKRRASLNSQLLAAAIQREQSFLFAETVRRAPSWPDMWLYCELAYNGINTARLHLAELASADGLASRSSAETKAIQRAYGTTLERLARVATLSTVLYRQAERALEWSGESLRSAKEYSADELYHQAGLMLVHGGDVGDVLDHAAAYARHLAVIHHSFEAEIAVIRHP